jgi:hypothetical protein
MSVRTTETTVTFRRPFSLAALDDLQLAGTYRLTIDEEEIPPIVRSFIAATIHFPVVLVQPRPCSPCAAELAAALEADAAS